MHMMRRLKSIASGRSSVSDPVRMLDPSLCARSTPGQRFAARPRSRGAAFGVNDLKQTRWSVLPDLLNLAQPAAASLVCLVAIGILL
jgi:hypothetical protein